MRVSRRKLFRCDHAALTVDQRVSHDERPAFLARPTLRGGHVPGHLPDQPHLSEERAKEGQSPRNRPVEGLTEGGHEGAEEVGRARLVSARESSFQMHLGRDGEELGRDLGDVTESQATTSAGEEERDEVGEEGSEQERGGDRAGQGLVLTCEPPLPTEDTRVTLT